MRNGYDLFRMETVIFPTESGGYRFSIPGLYWKEIIGSVSILNTVAFNGIYVLSLAFLWVLIYNIRKSI